VGSIAYPRKVPSVLDQHVLKATSGPDKRDFAFARCPHHPVGSLRIAVRAAGPDDDSRSGCGDPRSVLNLIRAHDTDIKGDPPMLRRMFERSEGRAMKPVIGRQIDQHRDDYGAHRRTLAPNSSRRSQTSLPGIRYSGTHGRIPPMNMPPFGHIWSHRAPQGAAM